MTSDEQPLWVALLPTPEKTVSCLYGYEGTVKRVALEAERMLNEIRALEKKGQGSSLRHGGLVCVMNQVVAAWWNSIAGQEFNEDLFFLSLRGGITAQTVSIQNAKSFEVRLEWGRAFEPLIEILSS